MSLENLKKSLKEEENPEQARNLQRFFKTGKGEYGEGDVFIGLKVPVQRKIARENLDLSFKDLKTLIKSKIHEERLIALMILVLRFPKSNEEEKKKIFNFYIANKSNINNWDLVDLSAPNIVGVFLLDKDKGLLYKLAKSKNLWDKRISVLSTFRFIKENSFKVSLDISKILLNDKHDLIHKAVGWMLREIGKRDLKVEEKFLKENYKQMPRTMLRYAIEKFPEAKRQSYLAGKV